MGIDWEAARRDLIKSRAMSPEERRERLDRLGAPERMGESTQHALPPVAKRGQSVFTSVPPHPSSRRGKR